MDALTSAAIAGTSRETPLPSTLPTDGTERGPERDLLLRAGMRAVYEFAGRRAEADVETPETAPEEELPACSTRAAEVVRQLLVAGRTEVLHEALDRLRLAGLRVPHALLPAVLDVQGTGQGSAVFGKRGPWLAAQNPNWGWLAATGESEEPDETVWEEGALGERISTLRHTRDRDPALGLAWVEDVWKSEKADARVAVVTALETGLSSGDEPFLERALDDRSVKVREVAAALLARIPGSAFAGRAAARADSFLVRYEPPASGLRGMAEGLSRRGRAGRLVVRPPEDLDEGWRRDLPAGDKPPQGVGEKAWRITLALSVVPPGRWESRFGVTPDELVASARGDWEAALLTGWGRAAEQFRDGAWAFPIWKRCQQAPEKHGTGTWTEWENTWNAALSLVSTMSQARFAAEFPRLLREGGMNDRLARTFIHLPAPWDQELSLLYVKELRKYVLETFARNREDGELWLWTLQPAAERIPPSCFEHALFDQPDEVLVEQTFANGEVFRYEPYHLRRWRKELSTFEGTLELRRKLVEEIPL